MYQTIPINKTNTLMIAHRGLSGLERENTCAAFVAAGNRSYYGIETDIHKTKDGHFIVYHDDGTLRLIDLDWKVEDCTLEELRTLRLKDMDGNVRGDLVLPTLQEYIRICKKYGKDAILELKNPFSSEDIQAVLEVIRKEEWLHHTVFISFDLGTLLRVRHLRPAQPLQYLVRELTPDVIDSLIRLGMALDIKHSNISAEQIEELHRMRLKVNVWTVDNPQEAQQLIEAGVDYITTNILE